MKKTIFSGFVLIVFLAGANVAAFAQRETEKGIAAREKPRPSPS